MGPQDTGDSDTHEIDSGGWSGDLGHIDPGVEVLFAFLRRSPPPTNLDTSCQIHSWAPPTPLNFTGGPIFRCAAKGRISSLTDFVASGPSKGFATSTSSNFRGEPRAACFPGCAPPPQVARTRKLQRRVGPTRVRSHSTAETSHSSGVGKACLRGCFICVTALRLLANLGPRFAAVT
jgi:hypothetical protein